jgi:hypothetical protein
MDIKNKLSRWENFMAYMGGSVIQITLDNPITSYRQLIQQYAKDSTGIIVDPKIAREQANKVFRKFPISASLSGIVPRLFGASSKSAPKFGFLWGITALTGHSELTMVSAIGASIFSAYCINPIRMIEKQQRIELKKTGTIKSMSAIIKEASKYNFLPLFRGTTPLIAHSAASASTGLIGQPKLQKIIQHKLSVSEPNSIFSLTKSSANLIASALVSPIYVIITNPLSRIEVIMQTNPISSQAIKLSEAIKELVIDSKKFGLRGMFRGQAVGIGKAVVSLTLFHEGRMFCEQLLMKGKIINN